MFKCVFVLGTGIWKVFYVGMYTHTHNMQSVGRE